LRVWLLRLFGACVGTGATVKPGIRIKHPWMIKLGDNVWLGEDCWIDNLAPVTIGSNACLSQACYVCTGSHDWSDPAFGLIVKPVEIRSAAWVGARAVIAPGVVLEEGAVAAIGSVVTKTIPAWQIHAGNPASFIRHRIIKNPGV
jgi:putative colanic acid biosynthesis acetyltransferase WcaF